MYNTYYPGFVNSVQTTTTGYITASNTTISVTDISVFPVAPNLATLGTTSSAETILYTGISGSDLTGVTRGFQGTATEWPVGTLIARYFTAYDHDSGNENIQSLIKSSFWGEL